MLRSGGGRGKGKFWPCGRAPGIFPLGPSLVSAHSLKGGSNRVFHKARPHDSASRSSAVKPFPA